MYGFYIPTQHTGHLKVWILHPHPTHLTSEVIGFVPQTTTLVTVAVNYVKPLILNACMLYSLNHVFRDFSQSIITNGRLVPQNEAKKIQCTYYPKLKSVGVIIAAAERH